MNCGPTLAVLLVIQVQGHTIRHHKFLEWGGVGNELSVAPQADILASKLNSSGSPIGTGHGILANTQQEIECCCD